MVDELRLREWINSAYGTACEKGFHEEELSVAHMLMLVLTEVSEVIDADRKGNTASLGWYTEKGLTDRDFYNLYRDIVKPSVEAELADVVIRICDTCGALGIEPYLVDSMQEEFKEIFSEFPLCERCFVLSRILCDVDDDVIVDEANPKCVQSVLSSALEFVLCMCEDMGIDIERHVELKMRYNDMRPYKNGKNY